MADDVVHGLPKAPARSAARGNDVDHYLRYFYSLQVDRAHYDRKWQLCSDYILARRDFTVATRPNQLRPHRITSQVATQANARSAAFVLAYLIDPTRPNLLPNVKRGLAMAGRETCLDDDSLQYVNDVAWTIFDRMMLPRARLMLSPERHAAGVLLLRLRGDLDRPQARLRPLLPGAPAGGVLVERERAGRDRHALLPPAHADLAHHPALAEGRR